MVLLAASVISKQNGKILLSRQFVEMSRSRIEGVLTAFSKLITKDKQHTFIETDTVRYVYQALMNKLYCVLITTKTSNILEDLETLRLFVRVINEYTTSNKNVSDEQAILDNAFTLLFAFDEIVALGYRENVNMTQVRTFIEMDSHEERVFEAVRQSQERDAKQKMREKAKELSKLQRTQQIDRLRGGSGGFSGGMGGGGGTGSNGFGNNSHTNSSQNLSTFESKHESKPFASSASVSKPKGPSRALKLGSKNQNIFSGGFTTEEQLTVELKQESKQETKATPSEAVRINIEEKLNLEMSRDGAVRTSELTGVVMICIDDEQFVKVKLLVDCDDAEHVQMQSHPNVDKELFKQQGLITLRGKSFPLKTSVGVLKYRRVSPSGEDWPPLVINCWPNGNNCNLELVVNKPLSELTISIPCPSQPTVNECTEGDYSYRRGALLWNISVISPDTKSATMDFDVPSSANEVDYFPINCTFSATQNLAGLIIKDVVDDEMDDVKWSLDSKLSVEKYEIN